jgi:Flp pilus assembly protein TadG
VRGRFARETRGQSLVEIALALPVLLILVLGIADLGRFGYYAIALSHATQDAAAYAARTPSVDAASVQESVCAEMRLGAECATAISNVTVTRQSTDTTVRVRVVYQFTLITGTIADRLGARPIAVTSEATFPGYTQ